MITVSLPKASRSITNGRYHWLASNFAASMIQEFQEQPYATIPTTDPGTTGFNASCDCGAVNMSTFNDQNYNPPAQMMDSGITYTRHVCINLVHPPGTPTFTPVCADGTSGPLGHDQGLKDIRVRVVWKVGITDYYTDAETRVTR